MTIAIEAGIRPHRIEFIRETTEGVTPTDPDWERYSDCMGKVTVRPNTNVTERRCIGQADVGEFYKGMEDHEIEIMYDLQRWIESAGDAGYDGLIRDADNELQASHSILIREDRSTGGALLGGRRTYTVCQGAKPGKVKLTGEPESGNPVEVTITYTCELIRSVQIDQPASGSTVSVVSSNAADTTQTVTVENEDAGSSEDISLNGTTPAAGATSFSDIDSISIDAETVGDVTVSIGGTDICVIKGSASYEGVEGDLGVPPLGAGSHAASIGTAFEKFLGDTVTWDGGDLADNISTFEIEVDNHVEALPRNDSFRKRIIAGIREVKVRATVFGTSSSHDAILNHLAGTEGDIVWTLTGGTLTGTDARLTEPGDRTIERGQTVMRLNNVFTPKTLAAAATP
jgi:hypothetical protein